LNIHGLDAGRTVQLDRLLADAGANSHPLLISGNLNLALGFDAGDHLISGSHNIYLGSPGGAADESNTLRLGSEDQTRAFIAGVSNTPIIGNTVMIDSNGQLGRLVSSARYKQDIQPLGAQGEKLQQLRAVTFHYKQAPQGPRQYGLIAEEVATVYPELVTRNAKGEVEGVRYDELAPLLLNEVQQQQHQLRAQAQQMSTVSQQLAELKAQNEQLRAQGKEQQEQNAALAARLAQLEEATARTATLAYR